MFKNKSDFIAFDIWKAITILYCCDIYPLLYQKKTFFCVTFFCGHFLHNFLGQKVNLSTMYVLNGKWQIAVCVYF